MRHALLSLALLLVCGTASADVGPAPTCPTGQVSAYLYGRYCAPVECVSDAQCPGDSSCEERALCLATRSADRPEAVAVAGTCENGRCPDGATCAKRKFCGPRTSGSSASGPALEASESSRAAGGSTAEGSEGASGAASGSSGPAAQTAPSTTSSSPGRGRGCGIAHAGATFESALPLVVLALGFVLLRRDRRPKAGPRR